MMRIDLFAFGGGFSSLPLMFDQFVNRGAIDPKAFIDGVALGQVTPGPIVITATFFGYRSGGLLAAIAATMGIFFPSFALVVTLAPAVCSLVQVAGAVTLGR
jgi:chromate transporter